ncbi:CRISPR-associated endonuclease Cas2 [Gemella morbillorum]
MRILVMFDLPTETSEDRRNYRQFRKNLIKNGFIMMQESIYVKLVMNQGSADLVVKNIRRFCSGKGLVQILQVTEKQFSKMEFLVGEAQTDYVDSDERFIEL